MTQRDGSRHALVVTEQISDIAAVEFLGSAGIGVLVQVDNNDRDMPYAVVAHGPATSRPLHLLGLDKMFPIYPSVADVINGWAWPQTKSGSSAR